MQAIPRTAMALLCAFAAWAQKPSSGTQDMIKIPVSPKIPRADWPRPDVPDFSFTVRSYGGQTLGVGLSEFDWYLQVDARRSVLSVESFRSDADVRGQPIGVFRKLMTDPELREFYDLAVRSKLESLRPAMRRHPDPTQRVYTLLHPPHTPLRQLINNADEETNATIAPLRTRINQLLAGSFAHGERAIRAGIRWNPRKDVFEVSMQNIGIERVSFTDPRWIMPDGPLHRAAVLITQYPVQKPGDPPPLMQWREVALTPLQPYPMNEPVLTLEPGASWTGLTQPWQREPGMRYVAYFTWANYKGAPAVGGAYRVRGKTDSQRMFVEP
jgi:hypothetical protein